MTSIKNKNLNLKYYQNFYSNKDATYLYNTFEKLLEYRTDEESSILLNGKTIKIPRKQTAYGAPGLSYTFTGNKVPVNSWNNTDKVSKLLLKIRNKIRKHTKIEYNFVLINRYKNGTDYIGYHFDSEYDLVDKSSIAGISLGAERDMLFKNQKSGDVEKVFLEHGSLVTIDYPTNKFWKHSIPKRKKCVYPRISLTFRQMK